MSAKRSRSDSEEISSPEESSGDDFKSGKHRSKGTGVRGIKRPKRSSSSSESDIDSSSKILDGKQRVKQEDVQKFLYESEDEAEGSACSKPSSPTGVNEDGVAGNVSKSKHLAESELPQKDAKGVKVEKKEDSTNSESDDSDVALSSFKSQGTSEVKGKNITEKVKIEPESTSGGDSDDDLPLKRKSSKSEGNTPVKTKSPSAVNIRKAKKSNSISSGESASSDDDEPRRTNLKSSKASRDSSSDSEGETTGKKDKPIKGKKKMAGSSGKVKEPKKQITDSSRTPKKNLKEAARKGDSSLDSDAETSEEEMHSSSDEKKKSRKSNNKVISVSKKSADKPKKNVKGKKKSNKKKTSSSSESDADSEEEDNDSSMEELSDNEEKKSKGKKAKKAAVQESRKRNWRKAMEDNVKVQECIEVGSNKDVYVDTIARLRRKLSSANVDLLKKNAEIEQLKEKNLESLMLIKALTRENLELRNVRYLGESDEQESFTAKIPKGNTRRNLSKIWGEGDLNCAPSKSKEPKRTATAGIVHSPTPLQEEPEEGTTAGIVHTPTQWQEEPLLASSATPAPTKKVAEVATDPHGSNDVHQWPPFLQETDGMIHVGYGVWITCKAWGVCKARPVLSKKGEDPEIKYCKNVCYAVVGDKMMERSITGNTAPKFRGINEPKKQLTPEKYKAIYGIMERAWSQDDKLKREIPFRLKQLITKAFASKSCDMVKYQRKKLLKSSE